MLKERFLVKFMKHHILFLFFFILISCNESKEIELFEVEYYGALKNMMHENDISAKVDLSDYKEREHFYALGALENLTGEIQIFDGEPFNTQVQGDFLVFDKTFDFKGTLLVGASVSKWVTIDIPNDIKSYEQLEVFIEEQAKEKKIDTNKPFPFLVDGEVSSFDWHVINWKEDDTEHTHEKHVTSGLNGTIQNRELNMLGFYSNAHHAIFTHHTTNMHIHFKTIDDELAGHVDALTLGENMVLKLPLVPESE